jgi:hypothetical protein
LVRTGLDGRSIRRRIDRGVVNTTRRIARTLRECDRVDAAADEENAKHHNHYCTH